MAKMTRNEIIRETRRFIIGMGELAKEALDILAYYDDGKVPLPGLMKIEGVTVYGKDIYLKTEDIVDCRMAEQLLKSMIDHQQDPKRIRAEALGKVEMIKRGDEQHNQEGKNE